MHKHITTWTLYGAIGILFFIDLVINTIMHQPYSFFLLGLFAVLVCYSHILGPLALTTTLLMIQSTLYFKGWYLPLIYCIPLILTNMVARPMLYPNSWLAPLVVAHMLGLQLFLSAWIQTGIAPEVPYTSATFVATIVITWCFSLTYIMHGDLDSRL